MGLPLGTAPLLSIPGRFTSFQGSTTMQDFVNKINKKAGTLLRVPAGTVTRPASDADAEKPVRVRPPAPGQMTNLGPAPRQPHAGRDRGRAAAAPAPGRPRPSSRGWPFRAVTGRPNQ